MLDQPYLFKELVVRDPYAEGVGVFDTGPMGSGKTALMIHQLRRVFDNKRQVTRDLREKKIPKESVWEYEQIAREKIYWIGDSDGQWKRFPERVAEKLVLVEDGLELKFYANKVPMEVRSVPFVDFDDVVAYASPHKLNVVYIRDPLRVMDFIQHLINTSLGEWSSVAVDEVEDICPAYMGKTDFHRAKQFTRQLAKSRKADVSMYATLQSDSQLDWRAPNIVPYRGLCSGSKPPSGWKIYPQTAAGVPLGQAHIATRPQFELISYPPYLRGKKIKVKGIPMWTEMREQIKKEMKRQEISREAAKAKAREKVLYNRPIPRMEAESSVL